MSYCHVLQLFEPQYKNVWKDIRAGISQTKKAVGIMKLGTNRFCARFRHKFIIIAFLLLFPFPFCPPCIWSCT